MAAAESLIATLPGKKKGGSEGAARALLPICVSEVELRAKTEVAAHDVRSRPCRVVLEQVVRRRRFERRADVEHVQHVRIHRVLVVELVTDGEIRVPGR